MKYIFSETKDPYIINTLNNIYVVASPTLSLIFCALAFICAQIFKKQKSTVFKYLYANTICDIFVNIAGFTFGISHYIVLKYNFADNVIYMAFLIYFCRITSVCSAVLSVMIMFQRYVFVITQKYYFKRFTNKIITSIVIATCILFLPFFIFIIIRECEKIDNKKNFNSTNQTLSTLQEKAPFFILFKKPILYKIFGFYQYWHITNILLMLLLSILTIIKLVSYKKKLRKNHQHIRTVSIIYNRRNQNLRLNQLTVSQRDYSKMSFRLSVMIVLITLTFVLIQALIILLTQAFKYIESNSNNYKFLYIVSHTSNVLLNYLFLLIYYKFDRTIAYHLKHPLQFYFNYLRNIKFVYQRVNT